MAKNKLPKRVAGIRLSKRVRTVGGKARAALDNPIVANLVTAALLYAADALRESKPGQNLTAKVKAKAADAEQWLEAEAALPAGKPKTAAKRGGRKSGAKSRRRR